MRKKKEKKENRVIRVSDRLWDTYVKACEEMGLVPSQYIRKQLRDLVKSYEEKKPEN